MSKAYICCAETGRHYGVSWVQWWMKRVLKTCIGSFLKAVDDKTAVKRVKKELASFFRSTQMARSIYLCIFAKKSPPLSMGRQVSNFYNKNHYSTPFREGGRKKLKKIT